jgi:hypothetical protein
MSLRKYRLNPAPRTRDNIFVVFWSRYSSECFNFSEKSTEIIMLEGSKATPARPSDSSTIKANTLQLLPIGAWNKVSRISIFQIYGQSYVKF